MTGTSLKMSSVAEPVSPELNFYHMFAKPISEALTLWIDEVQREGTIGGG